MVSSLRFLFSRKRKTPGLTPDALLSYSYFLFPRVKGTFLRPLSDSHIYIASMPYAKSKNNQLIVLYQTYHSIIADPIAPLPAAVCRQSLSVHPWIFTANQIFFNPGLDHFLCVSVELFKLSVKSCRCFYAVCHMS